MWLFLFLLPLTRYIFMSRMHMQWRDYFRMTGMIVLVTKPDNVFLPHSNSHSPMLKIILLTQFLYITFNIQFFFSFHSNTTCFATCLSVTENDPGWYQGWYRIIISTYSTLLVRSALVKKFCISLLTSFEKLPVVKAVTTFFHLEDTSPWSRWTPGEKWLIDGFELYNLCFLPEKLKSIWQPVWYLWSYLIHAVSETLFSTTLISRMIFLFHLCVWRHIQWEWKKSREWGRRKKGRKERKWNNYVSFGRMIFRSWKQAFQLKHNFAMLFLIITGYLRLVKNYGGPEGGTFLPR